MTFPQPDTPALRLGDDWWLYPIGDDGPQASPGDARTNLLRRHLATLAGIPADALAFRRDPSGKPHLDLPPQDGPRSRLSFSVAHRPGLMAIATAWDGPVGVDVERLADGEDAQAIAGDFFTPGEIRWLQGLPDTDRAWGFLYLWTGKEAACKADGRGIVDGLAEPDFATLFPDGRLPLLTPCRVRLGSRDWLVDWARVGTADAWGPAIVARAKVWPNGKNRTF